MVTSAVGVHRAFGDSHCLRFNRVRAGPRKETTEGSTEEVTL